MDNSFSQEELSRMVRQLLEDQELLQNELRHLRKKVEKLEKSGTEEFGSTPSEAPQAPKPVPDPSPVPPREEPVYEAPKLHPVPAPVPVPQVREEAIHTAPTTATPRQKDTFESLIGGNITNKIGIVVLLLGLGYLMKYSYDKGLLSPLGRIVSGYVASGVLLGLSFYLARKYKNFAAVLGSGGIAVAYFTTYFGWSAYELYSPLIAFPVMIALTMGLMGLARYFKLQIIGLLGAVGAYVIPILLDTGSGRVDLMFSYMLVINMGILFISFRFNWQWLRRLALSISWLFCLVWYAVEYNAEKSWIVLTFFNLFFLEFMLLILINGLRRKTKFDIEDIGLLLFNSVIYFIPGLLVLLDTTEAWYPGIYALSFAGVHVLAFLYLHFNKGADRNLYYLMGGLSLAFMTVAIPVELDGSWVTVLWAVEAAALFRVRILRDEKFYEILGTIMIALLLISLGHDWFMALDSPPAGWMPFINANFLGGMMVSGALLYCLFIYRSRVIAGNHRLGDWLQVFAVLSMGVIYWTIGQELLGYFSDARVRVWMGLEYTNPLIGFVMTTYTLIYLFALLLLNRMVFRSESLQWMIHVLNWLIVFFYSLQVSIVWGEYFSVTEGNPAGWMTMIKLADWALLILMAGAMYRQEIRSEAPSKVLQVLLTTLFNVALVLFGTVELNYLYQQLGYEAASTHYLTSLSIFWALYGLGLVIAGIWRRQVVLRIEGMVLLAITLGKLFLYDLSGMSVPGRIIVLIVLGIFLLLVSFLYQKFRHLLDKAED